MHHKETLTNLIAALPGSSLTHAEELLELHRPGLLLRAMSALPAGGDIAMLASLAYELTREEAQRAYCGRLIWLCAGMLHALCSGTEFAVPPWEELFDEEAAEAGEEARDDA